MLLYHPNIIKMTKNTFDFGTSIKFQRKISAIKAVISTEIFCEFKYFMVTGYQDTPLFPRLLHSATQ